MGKFKVEVKELGRNKVNKTCEVNSIDYDSLWGVVKPHLCSDLIEFKSVFEGEWGVVVVGHFRVVGKIRFTEIKE